jgi:hypothetical protein
MFINPFKTRASRARQVAAALAISVLTCAATTGPAAASSCTQQTCWDGSGSGGSSAQSAPSGNLILSQGPYQSWVAQGAFYNATPLSISIYDLTSYPASLLESQSNVPSNKSSSTGLLQFTAQGALGYVAPTSTSFGGWYALHPLKCGHTYQAVTPVQGSGQVANGQINSNVLTISCPVIR